MPQTHDRRFSKLLTSVEGPALARLPPVAEVCGAGRRKGRLLLMAETRRWRRPAPRSPAPLGVLHQKPLLPHQEQPRAARAAPPSARLSPRWGGLSSSSKASTSHASSPAPSPGGCSVPPRIGPSARVPSIINASRHLLNRPVEFPRGHLVPGRGRNTSLGLAGSSVGPRHQGAPGEAASALLLPVQSRLLLFLVDGI